MRWLLFNDSPQDDAALCRSGEAPIASASRTAIRDCIDRKLASLDGSSIYEARAPAAGLAFCFRASRVFAAGPEECGFCPVISRPSVTT
jgi:hypothetical protein